MPDVNPVKIRDTFFIWFYATVTSLDKITPEKTFMSEDDLIQSIADDGHVKFNFNDLSNDVNALTVKEVHGQIRGNVKAFEKVRDQLVGLDVWDGIWSGGSVHPDFRELGSAFFTLR